MPFAGGELQHGPARRRTARPAGRSPGGLLRPRRGSAGAGARRNDGPGRRPPAPPPASALRDVASGSSTRLRDRVRRHSVPAKPPRRHLRPRRSGRRPRAGGRTRPGAPRATPHRAAPHPRGSTPGCGAGTTSSVSRRRRPSDRSELVLEELRVDAVPAALLVLHHLGERPARRVALPGQREVLSLHVADLRDDDGRLARDRVPSGPDRRRRAPRAPRCRRRRSSSRCRRGSRRCASARSSAARWTGVSASTR